MSVTHPLWHLALRPVAPLASLDPASGSRTGGAARRAGGRGTRRGKGDAESAGLVLVYEACQGVLPHMVVRSTEPCPPEKPNRVRHAASPSRTSCLRGHVPLAPCDPASAARSDAASDPASGSRTGGAVRRCGEGRYGERWARVARGPFELPPLDRTLHDRYR